MSDNIQHAGEDNKARWTAFFDFVLAGGAENAQKAFNTLCEIGHSELVAAQDQVEATAPIPGAITQDRHKGDTEYPPRVEIREAPIPSEFINPINLNKCAHCESRGHYLDMFICEGCENSFHPGCVSENLPRDGTDPRFGTYLCPTCISQCHLFPPHSLD